MDHAAIKRLDKTLEDIRIRYGDARVIIRDTLARECATIEAAYWLGVSQSFSKQVSSNLEALHDAVSRLEMATRPKP